MNYYDFNPYFSLLSLQLLFNGPESLHNYTKSHFQQKGIISKTEQTKIEQISQPQIKISQEQEVIKPKKMKKQLKALCPELIPQKQVKTRKTKEGFLSKSQENFTNKVRNSNSNLLRMFFRKMDKSLTSDSELLKKIISKNKIQTSLKKIEDWFQVGRVESKSYIRLKSVKRLFFASKSHKGEAKVMRILLKNFLCNEALPSYLTSRKIRKDLMSYNLRSIRTILYGLNVEEQSE